MGFKYGITLDFSEVVAFYRPGVEVGTGTAEPFVVDEYVATVFVTLYAFHRFIVYF